MYERIPDLWIEANAVRSFCTTYDESTIFAATFGQEFLVLKNNEIGTLEEQYLVFAGLKKPIEMLSRVKLADVGDLQIC